MLLFLGTPGSSTGPTYIKKCFWQMNFDCGQNPKPGDPWDILGKETKEMHKEIKWQGFPTSS